MQLSALIRLAHLNIDNVPVFRAAERSFGSSTGIHEALELRDNDKCFVFFLFLIRGKM